MSKKDAPCAKQEKAGARLRQYIMVLLFSCTPLFVCKALAQLPIQVHYTIKDGLPSNKIYGVRQAPDGYIWIATNKGVTRFDGSRFRTFSVSDGLPTNDVFGTYSDITGKTWLMDFKNSIHYLKNDSLHTVYDPDKTPRERRIYPATYDKGRMCVSGIENKKYGWYWYVYQDTLRRNTFYDSLSRLYKNELVAYFDFRLAVLFGPDSIRIVQSNVTHSINISWLKRHGLYAYHPETSNIMPYGNKLLFQIGIKTFLVIDLIDFRTEKFSIDTLNTSRVIALNKSGSSLEVTTNTGLIRLDTSLQIISAVDLRTLTENGDIALAAKDKSGNIWVASVNNGLYLFPFFCRDIYKLQQPATTGTIIKSAHTGTYTYMLNDRNNLLIYSKGRHLRTLFLPNRIRPGRMPENCSLLPDKHNGLYISSTKGIWYLDAQGRLKDMVPLFATYAPLFWAVGTKTAFYDASDDRYYISNFDRICAFSPQHGTDNNIVDSRYNHIAVLDSSRIWLANDNGISQWEKVMIDGKIKLSPRGSIKEMQVENMIPDQEGNVITQIGGKGIMVMGTGRLPYLISEPTIQLIKLDRGGLWMVSDNGIRFLTLDAGRYRVRNNYPNIKRLLYDEVYDLYDNGQEITVMTKNGILRIPLRPISYKDTMFTRKPAVSVSYAGRPFHPAKGRFEQSWQNTDIGFSVSAVSTSYLGTIRYEYFMEGLDQSRRYTSEPLITYPVLSPGTYHFHIRAKVDDLAITSEEVVLTLVIQPRWWQSLWFKAGIFLLVLTCVVLFFAWRIKRTRLLSHYQSSLERKAAQMELMALQSQMNPHFIFNALGAVKSYFRFNRVQEAEQMLEDFAQLIRLYLEFSKNQLISLQQDISALQIYTAIEQRRFEYKFSVHFFNRMTAEQESSWLLPPMILQPFVENAINHGLFRKQEEGGWLKLFFLHREKVLTVVIDDNGVGRKQAAEIGSRLHKLYPSRGNSLVADRIQVLNGLGITKIKYEIIDKYNRHSEPSGTRVIIHFLKK
jgi:ligand-binding sensor domain-containing protein